MFSTVVDVMLLEPTPDQEFLKETTAKFLTSQMPVGEIRKLRDDPKGFDGSYWRRGADLGWTAMLIPDAMGGGSVSGRGLIDLTLIAHEFGRHSAPGPLAATNVVAAALGASAFRSEQVSALISGGATASWCMEESRGPGGFGQMTAEVRQDGGDVVLNGTKRPAESAAHADFLLVTATTGDGLTQVLVPAGTPGVSVLQMHTVDLTRRFAVARFEEVRLPIDAVVGEVGRAAEQVEHQLQLSLVISNAETVGAMERAFEMTVEWSFDRYTFGRPLASYQELKHRFADMKSWLESSHAIADASAEAVDAQTPDAGFLVSVAKAYIGHYGSELIQDCVQIHGGIGLTFEHDLHLLLRRATVNRSLFGTPADHRQRIASAAIETEAPR
jgi:alkylation response protein AidB-like acyl-CoA dehydrogenase